MNRDAARMGVSKSARRPLMKMSERLQPALAAALKHICQQEAGASRLHNATPTFLSNTTNLVRCVSPWLQGFSAAHVFLSPGVLQEYLCGRASSH